MLDFFENYRRASDNWCDATYGTYLHLFDKFLNDEYPKDTTLSQEAVDKWCIRRKTEKANSCRSRIYPSLCFLKFAVNRHLLDIIIPEPPKRQTPTYIPHTFTENELDRFFYLCDHLYKDKKMTVEGKIKKIIVPVFFRLLYSTGMRTTEARLLRREDIDLKSGIVNIKLLLSAKLKNRTNHLSEMPIKRHFGFVFEKVSPPTQNG
jgi:integrase